MFQNGKNQGRFGIFKTIFAAYFLDEATIFFIFVLIFSLDFHDQHDINAVMASMWEEKYCEIVQLKETNYCIAKSAQMAKQEDLQAVVVALAATQLRVLSMFFVVYFLNITNLLNIFITYNI